MYDPSQLADASMILPNMSVGPMKPLKKLSPGMGLYQVIYWPNEAPDKSKPWAVVNLQTGDAGGRWHPSKEEALRQARALYAQLGDKAKVHSEEEVHNAFFIFADAATLVAEDGVKWIEAIAPKTYTTPAYGDVVVTPDKINSFVHSVNAAVRGQDVAINYEHGIDPSKGMKAAGWIKQARSNDRGNLELAIDWTEPAKQELKNGEWKYFSLEWDDEWLHPDGIIYTDVVMGGALTNRPVAKGLMPINFSEIFTEKEVAAIEKDIADTNDKPEKNMGEQKELEHSQPGSGTPPVPRLSGSGDDDRDRSEGWRRQTPPFDDPPQVGALYDEVENGEVVIRFTEEEAVGYLSAAVDGLRRIHTNKGDSLIEDIKRLLATDRRTRSFNELQRLTSDVRSYLRSNRDGSSSNRPEGGNTVGELTENDVRELRNILGVDDDGRIVEGVRTKFGELAALRDAVSASDQERLFAEQYPQFYGEHLKLVEEQRKSGAKNFSESVEKIKKAEGFGLKTTRQQLSTAAKEKIEETYVKFSEGKATISDFEDCIRGIVNGGIVQFGEVGSSNEEEIPDIDTTGPLGISNARKYFAEMVSKIQTEHPDWDYRTCIAEAGKKAPDLAEAYKVTLPA